MITNEELLVMRAIKNKLKAITDAVAKTLPEIQLDGVTNKLGMIRKTAHRPIDPQ